jgi:DNA-binding transcriptional LysR family regulator
MRRIRRSIPSGNLLYVFDAAAKWESFTRAADELNVTPAAVSHAIRQLETGLGFSLFVRRHRQLALSPDGAKLHQSIAFGLDRIEETIDRIQAARASSAIKVYASITLGTYWLLPQLASYPDGATRIEMQLYNSDRTLELPDDGISLAITNGRTNWPGYEVHPFAPEVISPVCSPQYLQRHGPICSLEDLSGHRLLHLDDGYHDGITWTGFLGGFGIRRPLAPEDITHNNYILVIHEALTGAGVGLGFHHSMGDLLESGALVRAVDLTVETSSEFQIVAKGEKQNAQLLSVRDWLVARRRQTATRTGEERRKLVV